MLILEPYATANLVQDTKGLFQDSSTIAEQYESGRFARGFGFNAYTGQMIPSHTAGPQGGTPVVNATAGQTGSTLGTTGWTAAAALRLRAGDTFTIANVFAVNLQSRQSTGKLQSFVVTSDFSSDGSGNGNISIMPAIIPSGQFQTVDSSPAAGAAITVTSGTANQVSKQNLAFHPDAFTFATVDMVLPEGVWMADRVVSKSSGISMRAVKNYDINTDQAPLRLDVLYGFATTRPELAVRVEG
jgi:P22 coat protein - gene protein 5